MLKKISVLTLFVATGLMAGLGNAKQNEFSKASATASWSESATVSTLATNFYNAFKDDDSVSQLDSTSGRYTYFVRHGYLANNKCEEYTKVVTGSENYLWTDTSTDAYVSTWRINLKGGKESEGTEDGGIIGFVANTTMTCSIANRTFGGWPNSGKVNIYVKRNGKSQYTSIQSTTITNTSTEFSLDEVVLYQGDTFYFEFFQSNGGGNINFGDMAFSLSEYLVEKTISATDVIRSYYDGALSYNEGTSKCDIVAEYATDESQLFEVAVRHGNFYTTMEEFDQITGATAGASRFEVSTDTSLKADIIYGSYMRSVGNDGVVLVIKALANITFESVAKSYGGSRDGSCSIFYGLKENGEDSIITVAKETYSGGFGLGVAPIVLNTGDTLYFEFISNAASGWKRNIQRSGDTEPTFVISQRNLEDDSVEANTFMAKYMKLATVTGEGTGLCKTNGWYTAAKAAFNAMTSEARELFLTDSDYEAGADRLRAWATANGEVINASNLLVASSNNTFLNIANNNNSAIIIVIITLIGFAFAGLFVISRKRKHQ